MKAIDDPIVKELVRLCYGAILLRFLRPVGLSDDEYREQLPVASVDMVFIVEGLKKSFSELDIVERILRGESLLQAADWDNL